MQNLFFPNWPIFFEDNHIFCVYKPSGLLVQHDATGDPCLLDFAKFWLKVRYNKPGKVFLAMVHRIDRPVSGLVLFCKTSKGASRINSQFVQKKVKKVYMAIVEGRMPSSSGLLEHMIFKDGPTSRIVPPGTNGAKLARLSYRVIDTYKEKSLVEVDLQTGRHHQVRIQLASVGCPIVGDLRYGASGPLPQRQIALHCIKMIVNHPIKKEPRELTCPYPRNWPWPGLGNENNRPLWSILDYPDILSVFEQYAGNQLSG